MKFSDGNPEREMWPWLLASSRDQFPPPPLMTMVSQPVLLWCRVCSPWNLQISDLIPGIKPTTDGRSVHTFVGSCPSTDLCYTDLP